LREVEIRRFEGVGVAAVLAVAATLSGCSPAADIPPAPNAIRVCVDNQGHRTQDQVCIGQGPTSHIAGWYYMSPMAVARAGVPKVKGTPKGGFFSPDAGMPYDTAPDAGIPGAGLNPDTDTGSHHHHRD
jgi:hypothetical protein